jgi:hypothetical protein
MLCCIVWYCWPTSIALIMEIVSTSETSISSTRIRSVTCHNRVILIHAVVRMKETRQIISYPLLNLKVHYRICNTSCRSLYWAGWIQSTSFLFKKQCQAKHWLYQNDQINSNYNSMLLITCTFVCVWTLAAVWNPDHLEFLCYGNSRLTFSGRHCKTTFL